MIINLSSLLIGLFFLPLIFIYQTGVKTIDIILGTQYSCHQMFWGNPNGTCNLSNCNMCNGSIEKEHREQQEQYEKTKKLEQIKKYGNPINCKKCGKEVFSHQMYYTKNNDLECEFCIT